MVSESKYTWCPNTPCGSKVPSELTTKVISMPSATGRSMLTRRSFRSSHALRKNGWHENSTTGIDSTHCAQRSRRTVSASISPALVKYSGVAYIITCIMHTPATPRRHIILRVSAWRRSAANASLAGNGR